LSAKLQKKLRHSNCVCHNSTFLSKRHKNHYNAFDVSGGGRAGSGRVWVGLVGVGGRRVLGRVRGRWAGWVVVGGSAVGWGRDFANGEWCGWMMGWVAAGESGERVVCESGEWCAGGGRAAGRVGLCVGLCRWGRVTDGGDGRTVGRVRDCSVNPFAVGVSGRGRMFYCGGC
jgi:hypothetical protein